MINSFQKKTTSTKSTKMLCSSGVNTYSCQRRSQFFQLSYCLLSSVPISRAGGNPRIQAKMQGINPKDIQKHISWGKYPPLVVSKWHSPLPYFGTTPLLLWHSLRCSASDGTSRLLHVMVTTKQTWKGCGMELRGMELIILVLIVYMYSHRFWPILPQIYPQHSCSKQSHQGTVQSQLFQPCRQLLIWDHRGRHDIAWLSWDQRCSQQNPNQTANQLTNIWSSLKMDCNCLVWNWEVVIMLSLLKGPCGFIVFPAATWNHDAKQW